MLSKTIVSLASAAMAVATPISRRDDGPGCPRQEPVPGTGPNLPINGGATELPSPASNLTLKYILLGHGIQNYTCGSEGAEPKATGALAALYDVTALYPGTGDSVLTIEEFDQLGVDAIYDAELPLNMQSEEDAANSIAPGADLEEPFPSDPADLQLDSLSTPLPFVGHHFFNSAGSPQFVFEDVNYVCALSNKIDAPAGSDAGPDATGTVAWLQLGAIEGAVGASLLYRVKTVGGVSHGCSAAGSDSVSYTAQYWFYG